MGNCLAVIGSDGQPCRTTSALASLDFELLSNPPVSLLAGVQQCADELRYMQMLDTQGSPGGNAIAVMELYPFQISEDTHRDHPYTGLAPSGSGNPAMCSLCDVARRCGTSAGWRLGQRFPTHRDCGGLTGVRAIHQVWYGGHGLSAGQLITVGDLLLLLTAERNLSRVLPSLKDGTVPSDIYRTAQSRLSRWLRTWLPPILSPAELLILDCLAGIEEQLFPLDHQTNSKSSPAAGFGLKILLHTFGPAVPHAPSPGVCRWNIELRSRPVWSCWVTPRRLEKPAGKAAIEVSLC